MKHMACSALITITALLFGSLESEAGDLPANPDDGRKVLPDTKSVPAKYVGLIYFEDPRPPVDRPHTQGSIRRGTAFLVGDKHIVTCAHCITNNPYLLRKDNAKPYPDRFPKKIYFAPGHHGSVETPCDGPATPGSQPYGRYEVIGVSQIFSQYFKEKPGLVLGENPIAEYDLVVLELDRSTRPVVGGHFEIARNFIKFDNSPLSPELNINGYDADRVVNELLPGGHERADMWQMTRVGKSKVSFTIDNFKNAVRSITHQSNLTCKAYAGASGAPIWLIQDGVPTVIGITNSTDNNHGNEAIGLFFTQKHTEFIQAGLGAK